MKYSVVVPIYNEEASLADLHGELLSVLNKLKADFEIIFVNDGSTDGSLSEMKKLLPLIVVDLKRNYGQSTALAEGIKLAKGEIIITLDGDGQNDPKDIPALLDKMSQGFEVVCGWRKNRKDSFLIKSISRLGYFFRQILVKDGIHDSGCTLRVYKKDCFDGWNLYGEMHRMIVAILKWHGCKMAEIVVNHRPRRFGKSKYSWKKMFRGLLDMIIMWFWRKYEDRPMHFFGGVAMVFLFLSSMALFILAGLKIFWGYSLSDKIWPLVAFSGLMMGVQFLILGIVADLIIRNRSETGLKKVFRVIKN
ncbi:glycosyltransferase [Candidatus Shapirobacteria bacterium]|nr:MAG: glycosyltransferase [Candidatus Shapirobacteria bacterium]